MKNKKIIIISSLLIIIICLLSYIFIFKTNIYISLNDSNSIKLFVNDEYKDMGATAKKCSMFKCKDISSDIQVDNDVDVNTVGDYEVVYKIEIDDKVLYKTRNVSVVDLVSPVISLVGNDSSDICPNGSYIEEGYSAIDNYDGNITSNVEVIDNDSYIEYVVNDSSNNSSSVKRTINRVDNIKPELSLNGNSVVTIKLGTSYNELGAKAIDNCYGDISNNITISSNVNTSKEGTYNVLYSVSDDSNNTSTINRTVIVKDYGTFNTNNKDEYLKALENYIKEKNYNVSLGYVNLNTGYSYYYRAGTVYYGASLVKTVDALYIYEHGNYSDDIKYKVSKAISVSDNDAHRDLVNYIGLNNLRNYGRGIGHKHFLTGRDTDFYGNTDVYDQVAVMKYLYNYINNYGNGNELKSYFINDYFNYMLFDGIPTTMHKYGYYGDYYHDVGIVYSNKPYIVVILTKHGNNNYENVVKDLSMKLYEFNKID